MAIDTAQKRASALGVGVPFIVSVIPDGTLDQGDRQTMAMAYSGILVALVSLSVTQETSYDLYISEEKIQETSYDTYNDRQVEQSTTFDLYTSKLYEISTLFDIYNGRAVEIVTSFDLFNDQNNIQITSYDVYNEKSHAQITYYDIGLIDVIERIVAKRSFVVQNKPSSFIAANKFVSLLVN